VTAALVAAPTALARATIRRHSKSFALASRLLDGRARDATAIVYTFCRRADDAIDLGADPRAALARLEHELAAIYGGGSLADPVLAAFARIAAERCIPRAYPRALLDGMAMDVAGTRYRTLADLHAYCYRVAGVVGLMLCHVFGIRDDAALVPAARLGVAMQLTNICRDIAEDWARGRLYVPDELLAAHGATDVEPGGRLPVRPLAAAVRDLLALADAHYRAADAGVPLLPWRAAVAVRAARRIYAAIGDVIARHGHDVTAPRAVVPAATKLVLVARAFAAMPRRGRPRLPTRTLELADVPLA